MINDYSYEDRNPMKRKGAVAEHIARQFIARRWQGALIRDMRSDVQAQERDIDFDVIGLGTFEVKASPKITEGQLIVELMRLHIGKSAWQNNAQATVTCQLGRLGWSTNSAADYLLVVDINTSNIALLHMLTMRQDLAALWANETPPLYTLRTDTSRITIISYAPLRAVRHTFYTYNKDGQWQR